MITIVVYLLLLIVLTPPLGAYLYRVYTRERPAASRASSTG